MIILCAKHAASLQQDADGTILPGTLGPSGSWLHGAAGHRPADQPDPSRQSGRERSARSWRGSGTGSGPSTSRPSSCLRRAAGSTSPSRSPRVSLATSQRRSVPRVTRNLATWQTTRGTGRIRRRRAQSRLTNAPLLTTWRSCQMRADGASPKSASADERTYLIEKCCIRGIFAELLHERLHGGDRIH
jgi:hypothetical protein